MSKPPWVMWRDPLLVCESWLHPSRPHLHSLSGGIIGKEGKQLNGFDFLQLLGFSARSSLSVRRFYSILALPRDKVKSICRLSSDIGRIRLSFFIPRERRVVPMPGKRLVGRRPGTYSIYEGRRRSHGKSVRTC